MAVKYSEGVVNARLDSIETTIGTAPTLAMFSGSAPANCSAANTGTLIASMTLPSDWMAAASGGSKAKSGTWQDTSADSAGTIGYFRIFASGGTCHMQGTCSNTSGGGDMEFDNNVVGSGQSVTVSSFVVSSAHYP